MNQYLRHIGDWKAATANLTRVQRDIYSALIDTYYDKERPILGGDFEMLAEDHGCRTDEEKAALRYILKRYFKQDGDVFRNERADEEITAFHHRIEVAQRAGRASSSVRAQRRMNGRSTPVAPVLSDSNAAVATVESGSRNTASSPTENTAESNAMATDVQREVNAGATPGQQTGNTTPTELQLPDDPKTQHSSPAVKVGGEASISSPPPPEPEQKFKPTKKCPKTFVVTARMAMWAGEKCPLLSVKDIELETDKFRDHAFGNAISDWEGAWRNWLRKEQQFRETRRAPVGGKTEQRDSFMAAVKGDRNGHITRHRRAGALDVESRVVREDEESAPDPAD